MARSTTRRHPPGGAGRSELRSASPRGSAPRSRHPRVRAQPPQTSRRLILVFLVLVSALAGLGCRLAWLQLIDGHRLRAKAREIQTHTTKPIGK